MVAGQQQANWSGKGQTAVTSVSGQSLKAVVRRYFRWQVFRLRQGMQTKMFVSDTHTTCRQFHILQTLHVLRGEREVLAYKSRCPFRACDFLIRQSAQGDIAGVVDDSCELLHGIEESCDRFLVLDFLGDDMPTAQGGKIALVCHALLGGLGKEQVTLVMQVRTLIEVSLVAS